MFLLSDGVRFANPRCKLFIEIRKTVNPKCVQMVSRRERFEAHEARTLNPSGENKVTDEMVSAHLHRDE